VAGSAQPTGIDQLLLIIDQGYNRRSWHGTNLRGSIRRVPAEQAAWRPGGKRHNIWEVVVHAAYWKYVVRRRLTGETRGSFPLAGSNWFERPEEISEARWQADVRLLDLVHLVLAIAIFGEQQQLKAGFYLGVAIVLAVVFSHPLLLAADSGTVEASHVAGHLDR
jgi:hypothetical protein